MSETIGIESTTKEIFFIILRYAVNAWSDLVLLKYVNKFFRDGLEEVSELSLSIHHKWLPTPRQWEDGLRYLMGRNRISRFSISAANVPGIVLRDALQDVSKLQFLSISKCFRVKNRFIADILRSKHEEVRFAFFADGLGSMLPTHINFSVLQTLGLTNTLMSLDGLRSLCRIMYSGATRNLNYLFLGGVKFSIDSEFDDQESNQYSPSTITSDALSNLQVIEITYVSPVLVGIIEEQLTSCNPQEKFFRFDDIITEARLQCINCLPFSSSSNLSSERAILAEASCCWGTKKRTPLHWAAVRGNFLLAKWLVQDIRTNALDLTDSNGATSLFLAAESNHSEIVQLLLYAGADTGIRNHSKESALYIACLKGNISIVQMLLNGGNKSHTKRNSQQSRLNPNAPAFVPGRGVLKNAILPKSAYVELEEAGDFDGFTPLHAACIRRSDRILDLLISASMNVDSCNRHGQTPLMLAARVGDMSCIRKLLCANAFPNAKDDMGQTAMDYADMSLDRDNVIQLLVEYGGCRNRSIGGSHQKHRNNKKPQKYQISRKK